MLRACQKQALSVMESWKRCSLPWSLMEGCIIDGSSPFRLWGCIGISKQRTALRLQGRLVSFAWRLMRDRAPLSRLIVTQKALQPLASALAHGCVRLGERRIWLGVDAARLHWRNALPTQSMELMTVNDWALTGFDGARNGFHCMENGSWSTAVLAVFKHSPSARGCMGAFCSVESSAQAHMKKWRSHQRLKLDDWWRKMVYWNAESCSGDFRLLYWVMTWSLLELQFHLQIHQIGFSIIQIFNFGKYDQVTNWDFWLGIIPILHPKRFLKQGWGALKLRR